MKSSSFSGVTSFSQILEFCEIHKGLRGFFSILASLSIAAPACTKAEKSLISYTLRIMANTRYMQKLDMHKGQRCMGLKTIKSCNTRCKVVICAELLVKANKHFTANQTSFWCPGHCSLPLSQAMASQFVLIKSLHNFDVIISHGRQAHTSTA